MLPGYQAFCMKQYRLSGIINSVFNGIALGKAAWEIGYCHSELLVVIRMQNDRISHKTFHSPTGLPLPACDPEYISEGSNWDIFHGMGNGYKASICMLVLVMAAFHAS